MHKTPLQRRRTGKKVEVFIVHSDGQAEDEKLRQLALKVVDQEGWRFRLKIIITDDAELRRLHCLFMGEDETTDVIAFSGSEEDAPGEIYVNLDQACEQALENGESEQRAMERLVVHGILHLGGWKDDTSSQRKRMLEYGEKYLSGD